MKNILIGIDIPDDCLRCVCRYYSEVIDEHGGGQIYV